MGLNKQRKVLQRKHKRRRISGQHKHRRTSNPGINPECISIMIPRTSSLTSPSCTALIDNLGQRCYNQKLAHPLKYLELVHGYCLEVGHEDWAYSYGSHLPLFGETFVTKLPLSHLESTLRQVQRKQELENRIYVESNLISAICRKLMEKSKHGPAWDMCQQAKELFPYMEPCRWSADVLLTEAGMLYTFQKLFQKRDGTKCYKYEAYKLVSLARYHCLQDSDRSLYLKYDALDYLLLMVYLQVKMCHSSGDMEAKKLSSGHKNHLRKATKMLLVAKNEVRQWGNPSRGDSRRHKNTVGYLKILSYLVIHEQVLTCLKRGRINKTMSRLYQRALKCYDSLKTTKFSMFFVSEDLKSKHECLVNFFNKRKLAEQGESLDDDVRDNETKDYDDSSDSKCTLGDLSDIFDLSDLGHISANCDEAGSDVYM